MAAVSAFSLAVSEAKNAAAAAAGDLKISGPHTHGNLAVYFIHGESAKGPVPLTLAEGLERGGVRVFETGDVNELKIENAGDQPVFIQSGDIVKGGRQDRVITSSLILKPKSGEVPLAAFCVEHGRWSSRGGESATYFESAAEAVPSREAKLAMKAPRTVSALGAVGARDGGDSVSARQTDVWASVARTQAKLASGLNASVESEASATSLQLSLENEKLQKTRAEYVDALKTEGESGDDIVGYAFAVNGKLNSADVYESNGLFRKMWLKQLQSAATEAIGERDDKAKPAEAPAADLVKTFLADAKQGAVTHDGVTSGNRIEVRDSVKAVYFAATPSASAVVHENYLAK